MKRSKMLEELAFYYETDEFDSPHDAKINASRVLRLIECLGMIPPEYRNNNFSIGGCESLSQNEWEPEDG